ncbi:MAG TPA: ScpA family protein [Gammaproteobacteria bacterium]|nr:ScpA family protein [Gammaproteobacteria bacterium]
MNEESAVETQGHTPSPGTQSDLPFARVQGEPFTRLPQDLYIPPDALEVILEAFEGPLDLLLYLIRRQNLDILNIPIAEITRQYMSYIELMHELRLDLAGEYLVMAAMLAEIKSRMLLPRPETDEEGEEEDPRAELVRRLQEYERYKQAAEDLDALPREGRDRFVAHARPAERRVIRVAPEVSFESLVKSFSSVMRRVALYTQHRISLEPISVRQRMSDLLSRLRDGTYVVFDALLNKEEGRDGVVVSFLALLELVRTGFAGITQAGLFAPIHINAQGLSSEDGSDTEEMNSTFDDSFEGDQNDG